MEESKEYALVAERIYRCACSECPVFGRIETDGYFPKFGAGTKRHPTLAIVSMNPSTPTGSQRESRRASLPRVEMHTSYESELEKYHRENRGAFGDLWKLIEDNCGLTREQVYYTETAKCVTHTDERDSLRPRVLDFCSHRYLRDELESFGPALRFVVCLGNDSFERVTRIATTGHLARLVNKGKVLKCAHPAASQYGGNSKGQFVESLKKVKRQLSE
jgi:hypothetical protein